MKIFWGILFLVLITTNAFTQQRITGKVISAQSKQALAGATVSAGNSGPLTKTDTAGTFMMAWQGGEITLTVSYVGFASRNIFVPAGQKDLLLIEMEPISASLEEVVVSTGYERIAAERATGSFTLISNQVLNRAAGPDIVDRLRGVTNGLLFDERVPSNRQLSIRGLGTIYGERNPLIVLNNFPYEGDINNINPNDVENITVLKDAAAASIWGVRAANGVIVITTKNGRVNQPMKIGLVSNMALSGEPDVFYAPSMSSSDFIETERFLFDKGFYKSMETSLSRPPFTPAVEVLIAQRDNLINAAQANEQLSQMAAFDVRRDFGRYVYKPGFSQQQALNIKGGGAQVAYYFSGGYDKNRDNTGGNSTRLSLRADNTFSLNRKISLNTGISYIRGGTDNGRIGYGSVLPGGGKSLYPYARLADENGQALAIVKDFRKPYADAAESSGLLNWSYVPLLENEHQLYNTSQSEILLHVNGSYKIITDLSLQLQYQYQNNNGRVSNLRDMESYYTRDLVNRYTQRGTGGALTFPIPRGEILDEESNSLNSNSFRGQLNYSKTWSKNFITLLAGSDIRDINQDGNGFRTYGYDRSGLTSIPMNYTSTFPQFQNSGSSLLIPSGVGTFTELINRYTSLYGNSSYTWDDRYMLSASARKDASNLFGVKSNQKAVPLWSAGLAWNVHNEKFFKSSWLSYLKLRLTYGYNGNLDKTITAVTTILKQSNNLNNMPFARIRTYPNEELRWEKVGTFNAGLDFRLKKNVVSGSLEFYSKKGRDLLGDQPIDPTSGLVSGAIRRNIADMLTQGIDLQLTVNTLNRSVRWQSDILMNYNRNKLTGYENSVNTGSSFLNSGISIIPILGRPLYGIYTYAWAGLDPANGDPRGFIDGKATNDYAAIASKTTLNDLVYHGSALPPVFGSLGNTFSYRNLSLFLNITAKLGHYFQRQSLSYNALFNNWNGHSDYADRWQKSGDEQYTDVPSMVYPVNSRRDNFYATSAALVEKADHIRLQDVNLSYRLENKNNRNLPFESLDLFTNLRNAGIIWRANKRRLDPDYASGYLPSSYSLYFGTRINF